MCTCFAYMYKYGDSDETMSVPMKPQPNAEVQHNNSNGNNNKNNNSFCKNISENIRTSFASHKTKRNTLEIEALLQCFILCTSSYKCSITHSHQSVFSIQLFTHSSRFVRSLVCNYICNTMLDMMLRCAALHSL